ncbi:hypothetical protein CDV55_103910 [Aspergillus turcosus]|uniref:Phosphoglycerate mutase family protein n=1 Tax=Aspergillus turcosus TaxID=1245748 RepID=A0A229YZF7_9EURO|nr:hypothetical protein CDV55_103910 [Aspergillus turcosus]RLL97704.1 hypothetical protein CFD26_105158 [Aspergillus turcosus]
MGKLPAAIIIARHGARLDAADKNWHLTSPTPYDPPLSYGGWLQSRALGARIVNLLQSFDEHPPVSSVVPQDDPKFPSSHQNPRKKRRFIIHTSPYLRCVQTAIAVSSGVSQHYADTEVVQPAVASNSTQSNGYSIGSAADSRGESVSSPVTAVPPMPASQDHRCLLRVDAFLGEWLSPDYFDQITPPPKSERLIAAAKAELLRRGDDVVPVADTANKPPTGYFPGGWGGSTNPSATRVDETINNGGPSSGVTHTPSQRTRAGSYGSLNTAETPRARRILGKINTDLPPIPDGAYMPPTPSYAISPSDPIPAGYVAHARNACVKIDYQWDSMREPQNWGSGGEYGEEWSAMHSRFRTGLERMLSWYRDNDQGAGTGRPRRHSQQPGIHGDLHQPADEDDATDTILIVITHGAGCNALVGALTGEPVLLDFQTASLTMSVLKDNADEQTEPGAPLERFSSSGSEEAPLTKDYSLRLVASTDHLRPSVHPIQSTSISSLSSPNSMIAPSISAYRHRLASRPSLSQGQFMIGPSPNSGIGSGSWSLLRPSSAPKGSTGLWGSASVIQESADDILPNFGDRRTTSSDAVVTGQANGSASKPEAPAALSNNLPQRTLSQRGLWGSTPVSKDREAATRRRWTVTERRV